MKHRAWSVARRAQGVERSTSSSSCQQQHVKRRSLSAARKARPVKRNALSLSTKNQSTKLNSYQCNSNIWPSSEPSDGSFCDGTTVLCFELYHIPCFICCVPLAALHSRYSTRWISRAAYHALRFECCFKRSASHLTEQRVKYMFFKLVFSGPSQKNSLGTQNLHLDEDFAKICRKISTF